MKVDAPLWEFDNFTTVENFVERYRSEEIQVALGLLYDHASDDGETDIYAWAVRFYKGFEKDPNNEYFLKLNQYRKTCLTLLYAIVDVWKARGFSKEMEDTIKDVFEIHRLKKIMTICVAMDKAQSLYKMKIPGKDVGMHWFCELHFLDVDNDENEWKLETSFMKTYPEFETAWFNIRSVYEGMPTMNKRLFKLYFTKSFGLMTDPVLCQYVFPEKVTWNPNENK